MKQLIIDAQVTGISGDKFLAALLDLLFPKLPLEQANKKRLAMVQQIALEVIEAANLQGQAKISIAVKHVEQFVHSGLQLEVKIQEPKRHLHLSQAKDIIAAFVKKHPLSKEAVQFSEQAFQIIFEAEAKAHNVPPEKAHLHEVGSIDTFLDILGAATILDQLALFQGAIFILPVALGSGTVTFSHGSLPVPVPAVTEIVREFAIPISLGSLQGELSTPTGVAILAALQKTVKAQFIEKSPVLVLNQIGIGFGTKRFENTPNSLRLLVGSPMASYPQEEIALIETNLDDCSGEVIGFLTQKLLELGAKDVFLTPIFMKKGRPATKVSVLCAPTEVEFFATEIMKQTSTIGVRVLAGTKIMLPREIQQFNIVIAGKEFSIRGKIAYAKNGTIAHFKPEFDDVKAVVTATGLSITEVFSIIHQYMAQVLKKK